MTNLRARAVAIYDAFTHEHMDRRRLLREMTLIAGSAVAAEALIASVAASPAAAQLLPETDDRIRTLRNEWAVNGTNYRVYLARPRRAARRPYVMVIHENRGLNPHIQDVTRRLGLAGFNAFAVDFLSPAGGTPADEDRARTMIGQLDLAKAVTDGVALAAMAAGLRDGNGRVGTIGFCWGGGMVNRLAVAGGAAIHASVCYYGPAPNPAEAGKVSAPLMIHLAGNDPRVNATGEPWAAALRAAGKPVQAFTYPGVDHAFNNDTSPARYNAEAARLAWERTLAFFKEALDARA